MKINRIPAEKDKKISLRDRIFMNLYSFFEMYRLLACIIIGVGVSAAAILFVLDLMIPSEIEAADKATTLKAFDALQEAGRHQDAIALMEYKGGQILKDTPEELEYKQKLSDSYIHVGDYSKAEKVMLDAWNKLPYYLQKLGNRPDIFDGKIGVISRFGMARNIFQLYEKMGDKTNMKKFYHIYRSCYNGNEAFLDSIANKTLKQQSWITSMNGLKVRELVEYDSIIVLSMDNKEQAIRQMGQYIDKILNYKEFSPGYKVRCLTTLTGWLFEEGMTTQAYHRIRQAVAQAQQMQQTEEFSPLGTLSDYCYKIHDVKMSKVLYDYYERYIRENYREDDFEYLRNYSRKFRYLEDDGDWEALTKDMVRYCEGMRQQIARNIPSMTEEQREYFAEQFDYAYNSAFEALEIHPSAELADLCFDNVTFKTGLLLRSNLTTRHNIERLHSKKAMDLYNELLRCRRELIYISVSGRHFFTKEGELKDRINDLEKQLAMYSVDFKTKDQTEDERYGKIQKALNANSSVVILVERQGRMSALVLNKEGDVSYVPIGEMKQVSGHLRADIAKIYHDQQLTEFLWGKVSKKVGSARKVYYLSVGTFNQIAIGSLYDGDGRYLCDEYDLTLLSNPASLMQKEDMRLGSNVSMVSLWGGINYGGAALPSAAQTTRKAITRGEGLSDLRYASIEVNDISGMLTAKRVHNHVYSGEQATEGSFKSRSGKGDYILHISTHGFFNDSIGYAGSMLESGLFFAGANRYWRNKNADLAPGKEDGILRAAEIATMNLSGCSMVVLSACETGLGYSQSSEGVYGLQRAFRLAGARLVLMSLWDVDDRATTILMTTLYKELLQGKDIDEAFKASQLAVREQYPSPREWGAFVLLH